MTEQEFEILLVEDSPDDTDLALRELKKCNLANKVTCFTNGRDALDYLMKGDEAQTPHLIFLDIDMPVMDGIEFIRQIKSDPKTKNIPIAVLTSTADLPDIKESLKLGVKSYIPKPITIEDIVKIAAEMGYFIKLVKQ